MDQGLTTGRAAKYLGLHYKTVQRLDKEGTLRSWRTKGNRRVFSKDDLDAFLGRTAVSPTRVLAYCRVSSQAQKPDLKNQRSIIEEFCIASGRANVEYVEEVGGGLNFNRPKFLDLLESVLSGTVREVIVAHKDRLCRFGFDLIHHLCRRQRCVLTAINVERLSPEQEMVQDLMTIIHCFSSRLYGLRNYRKSLKEALSPK